MQYEPTHQNFFKFGYNGVPFGIRKTVNDRFFVSYDRCERPTLDWRAECELAARQIANKAKSDLILCLSGGIDSEVMVEAFRTARVQFKIAILRMNGNLNGHDIEWALRYCAQHQLPYQKIELDIDDFYLGGELDDIALRSQCIYPGIVIQMKLIQQIIGLGGFPVLGSGDIFPECTGNQWKVVHKEPYKKIMLAPQIFGGDGVPSFFHFNPTIVRSFLVDPDIQNLFLKSSIPPGKYRVLKEMVLGRYFNFERRPKYYGFEKFVELNQSRSLHLSRLMPGCNQQVTLRYDDLMKALTYEQK